MDVGGGDSERVGGDLTPSGRNMDATESGDGLLTPTTTCASLYELAAMLPSVEEIRNRRTTMGETAEGEDGCILTGDNHAAVTGENTHVEHSRYRGPSHDWGSLPSEALLQIFSHLSVRNLGRVAQTCCHWRFVSQHPLLWQYFEFNLAHNKCDDSQTTPTPTGLVDHILRHHARHLKFVVFKTDSSVESARTACRILARLVNCSLRTLSLVSSARPVFLDVDQDAFVSALTVVLDRSDALASLAIDHTPVDDPSLEALASSRSSRTLRLLGMKSCPRVSPQGVLALADHCRCLRDLSLSYFLLSDALLLALSTGRRVRLETLRVDVHTDAGRRLPDISPASWASLVAHSPTVDLVVYSFATGDDDCMDRLFTSYVPVTHLFFGDHAPKRVLGRLGRFCPRLKELVVGADGNSFLDEELQGIARGCSSLECLGLAECEVTCSGFVEVVRLCGGRLKQLFVTEECLVEDRDCDLVQMCKRVSELIGRDWCPEFVPCW